MGCSSSGNMSSLDPDLCVALGLVSHPQVLIKSSFVAETNQCGRVVLTTLSHACTHVHTRTITQRHYYPTSHLFKRFIHSC